MDALEFYLSFAQAQACNYGRAVGVKQLSNIFSMPISTIKYHLKSLMARGIIMRVAHGKYAVCAITPALAIGVLVTTPMDIATFNYEAKISLIEQSK